MISQTARPLIEVLAEIEDARQARGRRHPLVAILALVCVATLCGYRSYGAMAEWGRNYGAGLMAALGFTRPTAPSAATLYRALRGLDRAAVEATIGAWAEEVLGTLDGMPDDAAAIDGKALRGSRKQGAAGRSRRRRTKPTTGPSQGSASWSNTASDAPAATNA